MGIVLVYIDHDVVAVVIVVNRCAVRLFVRIVYVRLAQGLLLLLYGTGLLSTQLIASGDRPGVLLRLDVEVAEAASSTIVPA